MQNCAGVCTRYVVVCSSCPLILKGLPFLFTRVLAARYLCLFQSQLLTLGGDLPLILPSELGGYWIDPPLDKLADVSPTSSHHGADPEHYDIMERDGEAKAYREFFRSRVRFGLLGIIDLFLRNNPLIHISLYSIITRS